MDGDWVRGLIFAAVTIVALVAISWVLGAVVIHNHPQGTPASLRSYSVPFSEWCILLAHAESQKSRIGVGRITIEFSLISVD